MASLIKIGNSQGIRLPKAIIKHAHLENANLEFEVLESGLLIKPVNNIGRETWDENINVITSYSIHYTKLYEVLNLKLHCIVYF